MSTNAMKNTFSYVHEAIGLFSPEAGIDELTAAELLRDQLKSTAWRDGLSKEFGAMLDSQSTDWMSVVENDEFCIGQFETAQEARRYVEDLLGPFLQPDEPDIDP